MNNKIIDVKWIAELNQEPKEKSNLSSNAHFHDFFQLVYVVSGSAYMYIERNKYLLEQNTVCIIPSEARHFMHAQTDVTTIEAKFFILDNEFGERISGCSSVLYLNDDSIKTLLYAAMKEYNSNKIYKSQMVSSIMYQVLIKMIRNDIAVETAVLSSEKDIRIQKIEKYINKHLFEKITLADLAKEVYMNQDSFLAFYKNHIGMTPMKHINTLRITRAKDFLLHSELNVTQIAEKCGYSSVHHFSKRFKENMHISPIQYKKKYGHFTDN